MTIIVTLDPKRQQFHAVRGDAPDELFEGRYELTLNGVRLDCPSNTPDDVRSRVRRDVNRACHDQQMQLAGQAE
jgi:hypothetical protein